MQRARAPLRGSDTIALRVGRLIGRFRMAKHFELTITDSSLRMVGPAKSKSAPRWIQFGSEKSPASPSTNPPAMNSHWK